MNFHFTNLNVVRMIASFRYLAGRALLNLPLLFRLGLCARDKLANVSLDFCRVDSRESPQIRFLRSAAKFKRSVFYARP